MRARQQGELTPFSISSVLLLRLPFISWAVEKKLGICYLEENDPPWCLKGQVYNKVRIRTMGTVLVSKYSGMRGAALQQYILGLDLLPGHCLKVLSRAGKGASCGIPNPFPNLLLQTSGTSNSGKLVLSLSRGLGVLCLCVGPLLYLGEGLKCLALPRQQLKVLAHILQPGNSDPDGAICRIPLQA